MTPSQLRRLAWGSERSASSRICRDSGPRRNNLLGPFDASWSRLSSLLSRRVNQKIKDRTFIFVARGMQFFFRVSNTLKDFEKRLSIVNSAERWITVKDCGNHPVWLKPQ